MKSIGFLLPYFNDFSMQIWLLSVKWNILKLLLKNLGGKKCGGRLFLHSSDPLSLVFLMLIIITTHYRSHLIVISIFIE